MLHLAIASDSDEYMGMVSLKHIEDGLAEFAITVRTEAMGKGYSWFGMESRYRLADENGHALIGAAIFISNQSLYGS